MKARLRVAALVAASTLIGGAAHGMRPAPNPERDFWTGVARSKRLTARDKLERLALLGSGRPDTDHSVGDWSLWLLLAKEVDSRAARRTAEELFSRTTSTAQRLSLAPALLEGGGYPGFYRRWLVTELLRSSDARLLALYVGHEHPNASTQERRQLAPILIRHLDAPDECHPFRPCDENGHSGSHSVRESAAAILGRWRTVEALPALRRIRVTHHAPGMRGIAAQAIETIETGRQPEPSRGVPSWSDLLDRSCAAQEQWPNVDLPRLSGRCRGGSSVACRHLLLLAESHPSDRVRLAAGTRLTDMPGLWDAVRDDDEAWLRQAAAARLTNPEALARIAETDADDSVRLAAVQNPHMLSQAALRRAVHVQDARFVEAAIERLRDQQPLAQLALRYPVAALANPLCCEQELLGQIALRNDALAAVLPIHDVALLTRLAQRARHEAVRGGAVSSPLLSSQRLLRRIAFLDPSALVRSIAARKLRDPDALARMAMHDAAREVRSLAAELLEDQGRLAYLARAASDEAVRSVVGRRLRGGKVLTRLARKDPSVWVRVEAVRNPRLSAGALVDAARFDASPAVRAAAAQALDQSGLAHILASDSETSVRVIAARRLRDERQLRDSALKDGDPSVRRAAVRNPALADTGVLVAIARKDPSPEVREEAVWRLTDRSVLAGLAEQAPGTRAGHAAALLLGDKALLRRVAVRDDRPCVRELALELSSDPALMKASACGDRDAGVRRASVRHVGDEQILARIARSDPDPLVRLVAVRNPALRDGRVLMQVACTDTDERVRGVAAMRWSHDAASSHIVPSRECLARKDVERITELWAACPEAVPDSFGDPSDSSSPERLARLRRPTCLAYLARSEVGPWPEEAIRCLQDQPTLVELARRGRKTAFWKITDARVLGEAIATTACAEQGLHLLRIEEPAVLDRIAKTAACGWIRTLALRELASRRSANRGASVRSVGLPARSQSPARQN
jgi:hypothetical protein